MTVGKRRAVSFRIGLAGFIAGMIVQFWLGMWVNLFVSIDPNHPGANPPEYFGGVVSNVIWAIFHGPSIWLSIHAAFGVIIVLGAFGTLVRALAFKNRGLNIALTIGALALLLAGFNGGSFLNYHFDANSMIMSVGFGIAVIAYASALVLAPTE